MTVLRIPAVVVLMVLWTVLGLVTARAYAADGTPLQWHTHAAWSAQVQPAGNDLLVLRFQPAWQTADPVLSVINVEGKVLQSAGKGSHFRAAVWNNGKIVAIRQIGQNNEVLCIRSHSGYCIGRFFRLHQQRISASSPPLCQPVPWW